MSELFDWGQYTNPFGPAILLDQLTRPTEQINGRTVNRGPIIDFLNERFGAYGGYGNRPSSDRDALVEGARRKAEGQIDYDEEIKRRTQALDPGSPEGKLRALEEADYLKRMGVYGQLQDDLSAKQLARQFDYQVKQIPYMKDLQKFTSDLQFNNQSRLAGQEFGYTKELRGIDYKNSLGLLGAQTDSQSRLNREQAEYASALNNQDWGHRKDYLDIEKYWDDIQGQRGLAANLINATRNSRFL